MGCGASSQSRSAPSDSGSRCVLPYPPALPYPPPPQPPFSPSSLPHPHPIPHHPTRRSRPLPTAPDALARMHVPNTALSPSAPVALPRP